MKRLIPVLFAGLCACVGFASETQDETQKVTVGTQTYLCEINGGLSCKPVNNVQQKEIQVKKNGGKIQIADEPRNLSVDIATSVENSQMSYDVTLCNKSVCTQSSSNGGVAGVIDLTMFGQYTLTEKSFYVLGFFISSQNKPVNLSEKFLSKVQLFRQH